MIYSLSGRWRNAAFVPILAMVPLFGQAAYAGTRWLVTQTARSE